MAASEVVARREVAGGTEEIKASAEATFDEGRSMLTVVLDSSLILSRFTEKDQVLAADWLPKGQTVEEHVPREEALDVAHEIFLAWVTKVRAVGDRGWRMES